MNEQNMERPLASRPATMFLKRVSWGAVFAGLVVSLVTQLTLSILGLGIGASTINLEQREPGAAMGIGALVWLIATTIISLFIGGYVAARLAGVPRREDSVLHGIITWGAQTLVAFLLITTAIGGLVTGIAGVLGSTLSAMGRGVGQAATEAVGGMGATGERGVGQRIGGANWDSIKQEAHGMLQQAGPQAAGGQMAVDRALDRMFGQGQISANPADREALVSELSKATGMSQQDAAQRVAQWEQTYQQAQQQFQQTKAEVTEKAKEAGTTAAKGISRAALVTFLLLVLGAISAAVGASYGRPRVLVAEPALPA
jgi:hypothetical protein